MCNYLGICWYSQVIVQTNSKCSYSIVHIDPTHFSLEISTNIPQILLDISSKNSCAVQNFFFQFQKSRPSRTRVPCPRPSRTRVPSPRPRRTKVPCPRPRRTKVSCPRPSRTRVPCPLTSGTRVYLVLDPGGQKYLVLDPAGQEYHVL